MDIVKQRLTKSLLSLLFCLIAGPTAFAADWRTVETPHYRLVTQAGDREATQWMRDFDQFILSTTALLQIDPKALPPLTVVIFDRDRDYTPYKVLRPNGKVANVAGQFIRMPTWSVIGMPLVAEKDLTRITLFHEATHWLASVDQSRQPAWFSEGIAELFSTFELRGDHVSWAKPIAGHLALLRQGTIPLRDFLTETVTPRSARMRARRSGLGAKKTIKLARQPGPRGCSPTAAARWEMRSAMNWP